MIRKTTLNLLFISLFAIALSLIRISSLQVKNKNSSIMNKTIFNVASACLSNLTMPWLGSGTLDINGVYNVRTAIHNASDLGYRRIDCAPVYFNEELIGDALSEYFSSHKNNLKRSNCCSHGTFLHFSLQRSYLDICYYHQDLHWRLFHSGLRDNMLNNLHTLLLTDTWNLYQWSSISDPLQRYPFSGLAHLVGE